MTHNHLLQRALCILIPCAPAPTPAGHHHCHSLSCPIPHTPPCHTHLHATHTPIPTHISIATHTPMPTHTSMQSSGEGFFKPKIGAHCKRQEMPILAKKSHWITGNLHVRSSNRNPNRKPKSKPNVRGLQFLKKGTKPTWRQFSTEGLWAKYEEPLKLRRRHIYRNWVSPQTLLCEKEITWGIIRIIAKIHELKKK